MPVKDIPNIKRTDPIIEEILGIGRIDHPTKYLTALSRIKIKPNIIKIIPSFCLFSILKI